MENEQILTVLSEMLEEQKENAKLLMGIKTSLNSFESRIDGLEERMHNLTSNHTSNSSEIITSEIKDLKSMLAVLPRNIRHEKRILLFPELNTREYYSVVLRWLLYIIIATYSCWVARHAISTFYK